VAPRQRLAAARGAAGRLLGRGVAGLRQRVDRVLERPISRLNPARHGRDRERLRPQLVGEDQAAPSVAREALEPVTLLLGVAAAAAAILAGLAPALGVAIGAVTVLVRAAVGAAEQRPEPAPRRPVSPIDPGSVEAEWIDRARRAVATFGEVTVGLTQEPFADRAALLRLKVTETVGVLERLAVRASAARRVLERTDTQALANEAARLRAEQAWADGTTAALISRALAATEARLDLHHQLQATRDGIMARLEMGIVHLERVTERMTRLAVATVLAPEPPVAELAELHDSVVAIRPGLLTDEPDRGLPAPATTRRQDEAAATG
jgi:hypothetical protein